MPSFSDMPISVNTHINMNANFTYNGIELVPLLSLHKGWADINVHIFEGYFPTKMPTLAHNSMSLLYTCKYGTRQLS